MRSVRAIIEFFAVMGSIALAFHYLLRGVVTLMDREPPRKTKDKKTEP